MPPKPLDLGATTSSAANANSGAASPPGGGGESCAVTVAVRPEKIALTSAPQAANQLAGRVRDVAYRGEASTLQIELATGKVVRVTLANSAAGAASLAAQAPVWLAWPAEAAVVLER